MIGKVIHAVLSGDNRFNGISIGPLRTFQTLPMPSVTYMATGTIPSGIKKGISPLDEVDFTVNVFSKKYSQVVTLSEAVRELLDRLCGTYEGVIVQSIQFIGVDDLYEDGAQVYGMAIDFTARIVRYSVAIAKDYAAADYSATDYNVNT